LTVLGYDLAILRHPPAGTARYATRLLDAMTVARLRDEIVPVQAWPRLRAGRRWLRSVNALSDLGWYGVGSQFAAARHRVDVWFSPANILPFWLPRPMVVTIHDLNFLEIPDAYDSAYRRWAATAFQRSAQVATRVVTDSSFAARQLTDRFGIHDERIVVAYPGVDHAEAAAPASIRIGPPARYALFVGQTEPHKNVEVLLSAWRSGVPVDLHLVIAGPPGRDDERLRLLANTPELRERVHFLGRVSESALARLYDDAHVFVFPSLLEGFGFPPLEAMARGVPTAVADRTSLPEITEGAAILFDPNDAARLAEVVTALSEDWQLRERLQTDGRERAGQFRWHRTAEVVWSAIDAATQRRDPGPKLA